MKTNYNIIVLLLFSFCIFGQNELSPEQVLEDYTIFKEIITTGHPSLYEYTSKAQWDSIFYDFEQTRIKDLTESKELFKSINSIAKNAYDGHLVIYHPKMDTVPALFPLLLKIIDGKLYTDTDDFGIPLGAEITSIEGIKSNIIIQEFLKYAASDGYNPNKKYRQIEKEFGILYYYEYGEKESFIVKYSINNSELRTIEIVPESFESLENRYPKRSSHFAMYHGNTDRVEHFKNTLAEKWPFVYYMDSIKSGVLTVNSFGLDPKEFKSRLVDLFKDIKKKRVSNLILDIRQNIGGYRINAINLFSFLTEKPFKQRISESTVTDTLPKKRYVIHSMADYNEFFKRYFASAEKKVGRWILTKDHAQEEMIPYKKPFKGKVYVLIGGNTFSAASAFALNAKNCQEITLVGNETGGGYYFHTAQYSALYKLPNSKIMVRVPFVKIDKYVLDKTVPKGSGVLPDIEVELTVEDLIDGIDSQLDYIVKHLIEKQKKHGNSVHNE
ncbi:S41 family peptidase [Arenibacter sp. S6351L]|uniref:S41 family peptidase n=1 Tax=Arenibacter sp. S6351L TaxID=2926407 RepID=UPI001FF3339C|nr:S41 family peptidase [Arenibacter sp. S6351L]